MLKYRLLTAIILIPLFVYLLFTLPPQWFCLLTAGVVLWAAWEWSLFLEIKLRMGRLLYVFLIAWMMLGAFLIPILPVLYVALCFWLTAIGLVLWYPKGRFLWAQGYLIRGLMGIIVLVPTWLAINWMRNAENGIDTLLFLFVLIWGADSVAYFAGKKWGKHPLLPAVSPGKTREGLMGALLGTFCIVLGVLILLKIPHVEWPYAFLLSFVTVLFSILGDLFESMLKRQVGLKDSGTILPGHGGVLDRLDSLMSAAPIFALGASWLSHISI